MTSRLRSIATALAGALLVASIGVGAAGVPVAASNFAIAGTCVVELRTTYSPAARLEPLPLSISFTGDGTCVLADPVLTGTVRITGSAATPAGLGAWSCAAGTASGLAEVTVRDPSGNLLMAVSGAAVTLTTQGGTFGLVATSVPQMTAAGAFAYDAATIERCATGATIPSATLAGALVLEDPDPDELPWPGQLP